MIARPAPSIADPARPTATFSAGRRELLGPDSLLGAAELARLLCRAAERRVTLLALTPGRLRRVDAWLTGDAVVTHGVAPDPTVPVVGALCARHHAEPLVRSIIESLVGPVPSRPADGSLRLPAVADLVSGRPPSGADWLLVVSSASTVPSAADAPPVERWHLAAASGGLVAGAGSDDTVDTVLHPVDAATAWSHLARLLADPRARPGPDRAPS